MLTAVGRVAAVRMGEATGATEGVGMLVGTVAALGGTAEELVEVVAE